jgi:hypothetical protein
VASIFKLSNQSVATGLQAHYDDMLAGNATYIPPNFYSIATTTVGSGGTPSITFNSIPSTYTHLQIRGIVQTSSLAASWVDFNSDSATNYARHRLSGDGANPAASGVITTRGAIAGASSIATTANTFGAFVMDILDYSNTNKNKVARALYGEDLNGSGGIELDSFVWLNTAAITTITFTPTAGNFTQYSQFALYGVR